MAPTIPLYFAARPPLEATNGRRIHTPEPPEPPDPLDVFLPDPDPVPTGDEQLAAAYCGAELGEPAGQGPAAAVTCNACRTACRRTGVLPYRRVPGGRGPQPRNLHSTRQLRYLAPRATVTIAGLRVSITHDPDGIIAASCDAGPDLDGYECAWFAHGPLHTVTRAAARHLDTHQEPTP